MTNKLLDDYVTKFQIELDTEEFPKQRETIIHIWNLLDDGKSLEAARAITDYRIAGTVDSGEPIFATLMLRVGRHIIDHQKSKNEVVLSASQLLAQSGAQKLYISSMIHQNNLVGKSDLFNKA